MKRTITMCDVCGTENINPNIEFKGKWYKFKFGLTKKGFYEIDICKKCLIKVLSEEK